VNAAAITREFLSWEKPFLPAAAGALADHYARGGDLRMDEVTLVVPGMRAGRRLKELLLVEAESRDLRLIPPRVITIGQLPELLYTPVLPAASGALSRRAWALALRELPEDRLTTIFSSPPPVTDLRGWASLARIVMTLHDAIAGAGLRFGEVMGCCSEGLLFDDGERWEVLAEAQRAYEQHLTTFGAGDVGLQRIGALQRGDLARPGGLWLCGVAEMPPIVDRMVRAVAGAGARVYALVHAPHTVADKFDALGCVLTAAWQRCDVPLRDEQIAVCGRPADQAREVVRFLDSLGGGYAADEVVVAVPDEELLPHLEQQLTEAGVPVHLGKGQPVERSRVLRLLEAVAAFMDGRRFEAGAALARHPDLGGWLKSSSADSPGGTPVRDGHDGWIEAFDEHFSETLAARLPAGARRGGSRAAKAIDRLFRDLDDERHLGRLAGRRLLAEWAPQILDLLLDTYGSQRLDRNRPGDRRLLDALRALKRAAADLLALPAAADEQCGAAAAIGILLDEVAGEAIAPDADQAAVEILGWLELHLDDAPVAIVTGFNEAFLPESTGAHAFLPNSLRAALGLVDNERRYARDAYQLTALLRSRERVRLIAGRRTGRGDPLRPSRLMFAVPGAEVAKRVKRFYGNDAGSAAESRLNSAGGSEAALSSFNLPPEVRLTAPEPFHHLSVSRFREVLADPYLFALRQLRRLEPLDDSARELDGMAFGNLAHEVLESFGLSPVAESADAGEIAAHLDGLLDGYASERYGSDCLPAVRLQVEQLRARLRAFARWQSEWRAAGWSIAGVECRTPEGGTSFPVDGEPFTISGRIDRIDHHPELGWALFDYKTGDAGDSPEATHRKGRDKVWVDLQLPLYRHLLAEVRDAGGSAPYRPADGGEVRMGYILLPRDSERVGDCLADWSNDQLEAADEQARQVVRELRHNIFHYDATLITPWSAGPLAALLGLGYLESASDEGGE
jgi:ATP-dependent helicase/nuclease subunit B